MKSASHVSIDEKERLKTQKNLHMKKEKESEAERTRKLEKLRKINLIYLPLMALTFVFIFWIVGLRNAELI